MTFPPGTWHESRILTKKDGRRCFMWFIGDDKLCAEFWYEVEKDGTRKDCRTGFEVYRFAPEGPRTVRSHQSPTGHAIPDGSTLCATRFIEDHGGIPPEDTIWSHVASWYTDRVGTPDPMEQYAAEKAAEEAKP